MKTRTCSYVHESGAECGRRHLARGYCELHYKRWWRGSSMGAAIEAHVHHAALRSALMRSKPNSILDFGARKNSSDVNVIIF